MLQKLFLKVIDNLWKLEDNSFLVFLDITFIFLKNIFITPNLDPTICKNKASHKKCIGWKNKGYCKGEYEAYMSDNCKASCGLCSPKGKNAQFAKIQKVAIFHLTFPLSMTKILSQMHSAQFIIHNPMSPKVTT